MAKVIAAPTGSERQQLERRSKTKHVHFVLLVILICLASVTFLVPDEVAPMMTVGVGVLICLVAISSVNLQYFQKCPRCEARNARTQGSCLRCGLAYSVTKPGKVGEGSEN